MIHRLTKKYRLIYFDDLKIQVNDEFESNTVTTTIHKCFESDNYADIEAFIKEHGLIEEKVV